MEPIEYEVWCPKCQGFGLVDVKTAQGETESGPCDDCDGLGYHPTEDGMRLLAFLRRHGITRPAR